jgi:hypothetical protein
MIGRIWRVLTGGPSEAQLDDAFQRGKQYVRNELRGLEEDEIVARVAEIRIQADGSFNTTIREQRFDDGVEDECLRQLQYLGHP